MSLRSLLHPQWFARRLESRETSKFEILRKKNLHFPYFFGNETADKEKLYCPVTIHTVFKVRVQNYKYKKYR